GLANARAYARLTEAAVRRERFFSAMSHDLRTPITAIVGYSELLADGIVGELNGQQHDMVERICQVSGHLSQLVNDILDLAKLDAGRMEFNCEEVTLGALVDDALVVVEPQARSKGLDLRTEVDPLRDETLCVDPPRVRQVLVNLLSNAVKFTPKGGEIRVGCAVTEPLGSEAQHAGEGLWLRIDIEDTGIPPVLPGRRPATSGSRRPKIFCHDIRASASAANLGRKAVVPVPSASRKLSRCAVKPHP
ncbi:MAG: HAMP domain-containing histidine kinase, partial [Gemmatimonadetes bacterium]|nr:HAMP domain-containing histidine kinase [Gemmatimonadota bacterium]